MNIRVSPVVVRIGLVVALAAALLATSSADASAGTHAVFSSPCAYSHSGPDDAIVFPGRPGAAHMHDFFGNTTTDAFSTYESLRAGDTTCEIEADTAAYWTPSLYLADGTQVIPQPVRAYYRGGGKAAGTMRAHPAGLLIIADEHEWVCTSSLGLTNPANGCPFGNLQLSVFFPDCWNGTTLDSADHRSHMAYSQREGNDNVCPASHPVPVPQLDMKIAYNVPTAGWYLSSGGPETAHADFMNAWDQQALEKLVDGCVNSGLGIGASGRLGLC